MEKVFFVFGPNGRYFFNSTKSNAWAKNCLPEKVEELFKKNQVARVLNVSFGDTQENYFFLYEQRSQGEDANFQAVWGHSCPIELVDWFFDAGEQSLRPDPETMRVVLGPNRSFFACDATSMRWSEIPDEMEKALHSWLSPAGWRVGPPRIVALGKGGAFCMVSEYGSMAWSLPSAPGSWPLTQKDFDDLKGLAVEGIGRTLANICMSPSSVDYCTFVFNNTFTRSTLGSIFDRYPNTKIFKDHVQVKRSYATAEILKQYDDELRDVEQRRRKAEELQGQEDLQLHYALWKSKCDATFAATSIVTFPQVSSSAVHCNLPNCSRLRQASGFTACRHDMEKLLRASGSYSVKWLKSERNKWHPDQFAKKCHPDFRMQLKLVAEELFKIYGQLIDAAA